MRELELLRRLAAAGHRARRHGLPRGRPCSSAVARGAPLDIGGVWLLSEDGTQLVCAGHFGRRRVRSGRRFLSIPRRRAASRARARPARALRSSTTSRATRGHRQPAVALARPALGSGAAALPTPSATSACWWWRAALPERLRRGRTGACSRAVAEELGARGRARARHRAAPAPGGGAREGAGDAPRDPRGRSGRHLHGGRALEQHRDEPPRLRAPRHRRARRAGSAARRARRCSPTSRQRARARGPARADAPRRSAEPTSWWRASSSPSSSP